MANDFVSSLLEFPPDKHLSPKEYDKRATEFVKVLHKQNESVWTKQVKQQNILTLLDPATNTLPYLVALGAQVAAAKTPAKVEELLPYLLAFYNSYDPLQVRYAQGPWMDLLTWTLDAYPKLPTAPSCAPLVNALLRLEPAGSTFTSFHLRLLRTCLQLGTPSAALPLLSKHIAAFPAPPLRAAHEDLLCAEPAFITSTSAFTIFPIKPEWVLEYNLLAALVYIGQRDYSRARLYLEFLLLHPSAGGYGSCSVLQVEAYKKWVLMGLLADGKIYPLPRTHSQQLFKSLKAIGKAYDTLAEAFEKRQWRRFAAEVETGQAIWFEDGNNRLVAEASAALERWRVRDLGRTYAALPIPRVASELHLELATASALLNSMVEEGYLDAHITPATSTTPAVLHFHTSSTTSTTTTSTNPEASLEAQTTRLQTLISSLRDADRRLQLSKEYIDVQKRQKGGRAGPDGDLADQMDLLYDAPIAGLDDVGEDGDGWGDGDEDLMRG